MNPSSPEHADPEKNQEKLVMLGKMAGNVIHDFNNLLAIIEGYAHMLQRQLAGQTGIPEKLQAILQATERGVGLTRSLAEFSRDKPGTDTGSDLAKCLTDAQLLLKSVLGSRVDLAVHVPREVVPVTMPQDVFIQVLIAFCLDARLRRADQVAVSVSLAPDRCFFNFKDNGAAEAVAQTPDMVQALQKIEDWDGLLHLYQDQSRGHEIFTVFPVRSLVQETQMNFQNKTVLIVDDEEDLLPVLEDQLEALGLKVLKAANADKAIMLHRTYPGTIDVLLTDVVMPGTNGVRLAEKLSRRTPGMGVVYMTGKLEGRMSLEPLSRDAAIVNKPLRPENLSSALQKALNQVRDMDDGATSS